MAHATRNEQARVLATINFPLVRTRDDLSFTARDSEGRLINWLRNNPGVASDWAKGIAFFDQEVSTLAAFDETAAYEAIQFAISDMGGRTTCLELGFVQQIAKAAVLGLRAMRNGEREFSPEDRFAEEEEDQ